jgi:putative oxidoreductase
MAQRVRSIDNAVIEFMRRNGVMILRVAVGIVFVWFGLLKVLDVSPVSDLVASIAYWFPADAVVRGLGVVEVIVGLGLITGFAIRIVLGLFFLQMAGTFLVFVIRPDVAFQDNNPFLLTVEGEFVLKNLVLIAAGLVVGSGIRKMGAGERVPEALTERAPVRPRTEPDTDAG